MAAEWESSDIGKQLLRAWDDDVWGRGRACVFLVVRSYEVYQELERLNGTAMCRWLAPSRCVPRSDGEGNSERNSDDNVDDNDDAMSTTTVQTDAADSSLGVIRLGVPRFLFEKAKAGLPACFLFGRKSASRRVDVVLGAGSRNNVSRVHFALGLKRDTWAVRNMCDFETLVNRDIALGPGKPALALWPGRATPIQVADIEFDLYCREPSVVASYLADNPSLPPPTLPFDGTVSSGVSSWTTVDTTPGDPGGAPNPQQDLPVRRYIFQHKPLESRNKVRKFLAMDPWTCTLYVAKQYRTVQKSKLMNHLELLRPLSLQGPFMRDEIIHDGPEAAYLLTRYREDVCPLDEVCEVATVQLARRMLRTLLKIIALLHQSNIVHNDICPSTVFVAGTFAFGANLGNLFLTGFSEASADMTKAKNDCYQIFQTAHHFMSKLPAPPRCWTGDKHLDELWQHMSEFGGESWPYTAQEICRLSDISLSPDIEEPKTISVTRGFTFRHTSQMDVSYLNVEDVKEYLTQDVARCAGRSPSKAQFRRLIQIAFAALEPCVRNNKITVEDYRHFTHHLSERHSSHNLGFKLRSSLPNSGYLIKKPIRFRLSFPVPYLSRYGLINLEYLINLAPTGFDPEALQHLLLHCYEVRGFFDACGVYVPVESLDLVAERLGVRVEDDYDPSAAADSPLNGFTYHEWYLLAANPMAPLVPVRRDTGQVLTTISPPVFTPLRTFLEDHFETRSFLDSQVVRDPEALFTTTGATRSTAGIRMTVPGSCGGSLETPSTDPVRFRFSHLPQPSLLVEAAREKRRAETVSWVEEQRLEEKRARRKKRKSKGSLPPSGMSMRGHIVPTRFVSKRDGR